MTSKIKVYRSKNSAAVQTFLYEFQISCNEVKEISLKISRIYFMVLVNGLLSKNDDQNTLLQLTSKLPQCPKLKFSFQAKIFEKYLLKIIWMVEGCFGKPQNTLGEGPYC